MLICLLVEAANILEGIVMITKKIRGTFKKRKSIDCVVGTKISLFLRFRLEK